MQIWQWLRNTIFIRCITSSLSRVPATEIQRSFLHCAIAAKDLSVRAVHPPKCRLWILASLRYTLEWGRWTYFCIRGPIPSSVSWLHWDRFSSCNPPAYADSQINLQDVSISRKQCDKSRCFSIRECIRRWGTLSPIWKYKSLSSKTHIWTVS